MRAKNFADRHLGPGETDRTEMLRALGLDSMEQLVDAVLPAGIRLGRELDLPAALSEDDALAQLRAYAGQNHTGRSYIGTGYYDTRTPGVISRNILQNPGWYTAYTPYQAEIAQGRLEVLMVFQTMISDLTGCDVCNSSLLDEATAAAEAVAMAKRCSKRGSSDTVVVDVACHPQTRAVVRTRAEAAGLEIVERDLSDAGALDGVECVAVLTQNPTTDGRLRDLTALADATHEAGARLIAAVDLLALTMMRTPASMGADIVVGSTQRFGVPLGFGGPHAAFLATTSKLARRVPGRIIGVSRDADGEPAYRMALQTREQHIRRAKATSNVCTAQVLPAVLAAMYAVYHGPEGLKFIANTILEQTARVAASLERGGVQLVAGPRFDTIVASLGESAARVRSQTHDAGIRLRWLDDTTCGISIGEGVAEEELATLVRCFGCDLVDTAPATAWPDAVKRTTTFMTHPVFERYRSETEMLRYIHRLQGKDLSLTASMIPLGSCTMKLNATSEMEPISYEGFSAIHPFVPTEDAKGYAQMHEELEGWLAEITGFASVSLQPNAGSQGEYAGLLVIRAYHQARGDGHRTICLIPTSAHGTNPASAVMAGMSVVEVACDDDGNVDVHDLRAKAAEHSENLGALMITYPSTHGVFEEAVREICEIVHEHGGQVYLDGANLNAMVGHCRPGDIGADVCHLNLHKTFCIPHGGGGPGMGPIGVVAHLAPFLPGHPLVDCGGTQAIGPVSAAPWGSPSILPISWAYIAMMGPDGLREATEVAILSANYIARRLQGHFDVLYTGANGLVAHECILDVRPFKAVGVSVDDIAKRLMDYGFHGPTMSWPVVGTLMVEPTESESKAELDRFIDAMIAIRGEIRDIEEGRYTAESSPLRGAPHTAWSVMAADWDAAYTRKEAAYPAEGQKAFKFWPTVRRVDNVYGDKNLQTQLPEELGS